MSLDHIEIEIEIEIDMIVAERGELGGSVQIVQAGQNMKQFVVVLLIEIHIDSSLITIRKPSTKNLERPH